jgi:DNA-binding beta-propeller fold protein YncE
MRLLTIFLLLLLAACAVPPQPTTIPAGTTASQSQAVTLDGTLETSLLATTWDDSPEDNALYPLNPASGTALPGYKPIALGYSSYSAYSPDRQTLAMVSFPTETTYDGSLLLIDLPMWKARRFELKLVGWVNAMAFSPDGKRLAIAHGQTYYQLTMVDLEQGDVETHAEMDSFVSRLKFTKNGEALMVYSPTIDNTNGLSADPPKVLLLDAADLSPRWSAELENVRDGIFPKDETITHPELYEPGNALYLSPGLVFAPDRDALYVVHPDSEQLTTVDFQSQTVSTVKIQPKLTWFERLLSLSAGVAHAKIADGTNKQAHISPDGQFLYVTGVSHNSFEDQLGNLQMEQTPLGLEIIQTSDGSRVEHFETEVTEFSLSPDGRFLYMRNWGASLPWTEIFDTSSRQLVARKEKLYGTPALLVNGEALLVSTYSTSETSNTMSVLQPDGSSVLAEWTAPASVWWLTPP